MSHTNPGRLRYALLVPMTAILAVPTGCVTVAPPVPSAATRDDLGTVAIVAARYAPASDFTTFAKSEGAGAAKGAAIEGGLTVAASAAIVAISGPLAAPYLAIAGAVATILETVTGAVRGARLAVPATTAREVDAVIDEAVAHLDAQGDLARRLEARLAAEPWIRRAPVTAGGPGVPAERPDYAALRGSGVDTVLEVAITGIGFESCAPEVLRRLAAGCPEDPDDPQIDLFMAVQARLVRVPDGKELFLRELRYKSPRRPIAPWVAQDGELIAAEFARGYGELAERVFDEAFLITPLELPTPSTQASTLARPPGPGNPDSGVCWLAPLDPPAEPLRFSEMWTAPFARPADLCPVSALHFGSVDSLRPNLRWSAFPRDVDIEELDPAIVQRISAVTYDLRIWSVERCERGPVIYERSALATAGHTLEVALEPATRYFWSVRARFTLDGRPMATRWSHFDPMQCAPNDVADWEHHRFVTPQRPE